MKVCFWSTTFQADNQALAYHLAERPGVEVVVALDQPERYAAEAIHAVVPFAGRMLERGAKQTRKELERFGADVVIVDNHLPPFRVAERLLVMWHGFGWRVDDLSQMRRELKALVGDVTQPNERFRWQAFGDWDRRYRIEHSGISEGNVIALGSAYSDWLRPEGPLQHGFDRARVQSHYTIDLARPTVLLALTWHHGGSLNHWGSEAELLDGLLRRIEQRGANALVRMHDRHRYEPQYVTLWEQLVQGRPGVQLKWKSSSPDSLVDLLVSDAMISNYSSILNGFYHTRRPSLHIDPADARAGETHYRRWRSGKLQRVRVDDPASLWKLPPSEVGGLRARSFDELLACVDRALAEPDCCAELARAFCERYVTVPDGSTCERIATMLAAWTAAAP
jgi:hypothetical protein